MLFFYFLSSCIGWFFCRIRNKPHPVNIQYTLNPMFFAKPLYPPKWYMPFFSGFLCCHIFKHTQPPNLYCIYYSRLNELYQPCKYAFLLYHARDFILLYKNCQKKHHPWTEAGCIRGHHRGGGGRGGLLRDWAGIRIPEEEPGAGKTDHPAVRETMMSTLWDDLSVWAWYADSVKKCQENLHTTGCRWQKK